MKGEIRATAEYQKDWLFISFLYHTVCVKVYPIFLLKLLQAQILGFETWVFREFSILPWLYFRGLISTLNWKNWVSQPHYSYLLHKVGISPLWQRPVDKQVQSVPQFKLNIQVIFSHFNSLTPFIPTLCKSAACCTKWEFHLSHTEIQSRVWKTPLK